MSDDQEKLSILGHIAELRKRLIRSLIVVAVTSALAFIFYHQIFDILLFPAPPSIQLQAIEMTEMIGTIMKVCLVSGIIVAVPYLTYEVIMFIAPALTRREKKYVYIILPWIGLMFLAGVAFAYFIMIKPMVGFMLSFGGDIATVEPRIGNYISIVTKLLLIIGLVFELPVLTTFLARIGILKPEWLSSRRKAAIIISFILAALITPTIDPINQCLVAAPLIVLYEMSIWLAKLVYKRKPEPAEPEPVPEE